MQLLKTVPGVGLPWYARVDNGGPRRRVVSLLDDLQKPDKATERNRLHCGSRRKL